MFEELRADDVTLAVRHKLADRVRTALKYAGVPTYPSGTTQVRSAAGVEVDGGNDEAGGVYVTWEPSSELVQAVIDSYTAGRTDGPINETYFAITLAMRNALVQILRHSGFRVLAIDDYAVGPPRVFVIGFSGEVAGAIPLQGEAPH
jgi:hypothetical protein